MSALIKKLLLEIAAGITGNRDLHPLQCVQCRRVYAFKKWRFGASVNADKFLGADDYRIIVRFRCPHCGDFQ